MVSTVRQNWSYPVALYEDYRRMLDEVQPDVAVIAGPFDRHAEMCIEVLSRNIHVFCEKPIALNFADLARVRQAFDASTPGTLLISMVGLRTVPMVAAAKAAVDAGAVGKVKMVSARKSYKLGNRPDFYKKRAGYGGTIPWVGSHALDWMLYFGGAPFRKLTAFHNRADNCGLDELEICAVCAGELTNGVLCSCTLDFLRPENAPTHGDDRVRIAGTDGVLEVIAGKVHLINRDGDRFIEPPEADRDVFSDFVLELSENRPSLVTDEETFALAEAVIMARDSADCGKTLFFK
jgi:predicted dehydrogenase